MSRSRVDVRIAEKILRLRIELVRLRRENKALRCFCKLENGQKMEFCGVDIDEAMDRVLDYPEIKKRLNESTERVKMLEDALDAFRKPPHFCPGVPPALLSELRKNERELIKKSADRICKEIFEDGIKQGEQAYARSGGVRGIVGGNDNG